eukprot:gnl/TRDRNA2_/TRDRNA2_167723_c1_seq2.p1 gnl/TRDRNA2_/TRDRNA2_167723_c1~~gnl/TRDRNA2_/TRDRNA2_167723_c1_seq2.p1  ORF type:complete len:210 (-),score=22.29 gnl/TRDRNA2_/TRDRNA2_167723_c1_seq2:67-696(-)
MASTPHALTARVRYVEDEILAPLLCHWLPHGLLFAYFGENGREIYGSSHFTSFMIRMCIWNHRHHSVIRFGELGARFFQRTSNHTIQMVINESFYYNWYNDIRLSLPPERVLTLEGIDPEFWMQEIAKFIGVPPPPAGTPFPHRNKGAYWKGGAAEYFQLSPINFFLFLALIAASVLVNWLLCRTLASCLACMLRHLCGRKAAEKTKRE